MAMSTLLDRVYSRPGVFWKELLAVNFMFALFVIFLVSEHTSPTTINLNFMFVNSTGATEYVENITWEVCENSLCVCYDDPRAG
jgi:hypothetical protein